MHRLRSVVSLALSLSVMALGPAPAAANGRPASSVTVRLAPADDPQMLLATTFGLLVSQNAGTSFHWVCEDAIGYGGTYDPDYAIASGGRIYATTFSGLRYSDDGGCTWLSVGAPLSDPTFVADVEIGSDGRVWASTTTGGMPNAVYVSSDGATFVSAGLESADTWWRTIRIGPSDPDRIYVSGIQIGVPPAPDAARLAVSINGGDSFTDLDVADFAFGDAPDLLLEGVSPVDPDVLFARVRAARGPTADDVYRSDDGGGSWVRVLQTADTLTAFVIRPDGHTVIAGTVNRCASDPPTATKGCVQISTDGGQTFEATADQPKMACLDQRSDGALFACGENAAPDMFTLGTSTDGMRWNRVLQFADIAGPLECPQGTIQDGCSGLAWLALCGMLGACGDAADAGARAVDGGGDSDPGSGCCSASASPGDGILGAVVLVLVGALVRPRRRRRPGQPAGAATRSPAAADR